MKNNWEDIILEAKRKYPAGTDYQCLHFANEAPSDGKFYPSRAEDCIRTNGQGKCCYHDGQWAKINYQTYEIY